MDTELKKWINEASDKELRDRWENSPSTDPIFANAYIADYFSDAVLERLEEYQNMEGELQGAQGVC